MNASEYEKRANDSKNNVKCLVCVRLKLNEISLGIDINSGTIVLAFSLTLPIVIK